MRSFSSGNLGLGATRGSGSGVLLRGVLLVLPHQERVLLALDLDYRPPTSPHPLDIAHTLQTPTSTPLRDFGLLDQLRQRRPEKEQDCLRHQLSQLVITTIACDNTHQHHSIH